MFKTVVLFMAVFVMSFGASAKDSDDTKSETRFTEAKEIVIKERGDYTHERVDGGYSNFRTRDGQEERVQVRPGDRLIKEQGTLPR